MTSTMSFNLDTLTLRDAIRALDAGEFSSVELIRASLQLARATEPELHAFVELYANDALTYAQFADRARTILRPRRPLTGVPIGIKDIFDIVDRHTRCNSRQLDGADVAPRDAEAVLRLRHDGAILIGKTVTQEYAAGVISDPCRNPWDADRIPGGSSGGSAAAVAVGTCLGALGSDTGGSIRIPASLTGTVGLKPTFGHVSTQGVYPLSPSLDTVGPIARTVADALILYLCLTGRTAEIASIEGLLTGNSESTGRKLTFGPLLASDPLDGVRIGVLRSFGSGNIQPDVATAFDTSLQVLRDLRAELVEVSWAHEAAARASAHLISRAESSAIHHQHLRHDPDLIREDIRSRFEIGALVSGDMYLRALAAREAVRDSIAAVYREHALAAIVVPTLPATAPLAESPMVSLPDGEEFAGPALTRLTMPWNATGQPVISVPCGLDADDLPIGISFVGRPDEEIALCQIAHAFELASGGFAALVAAATTATS
ncbi:MAG TPA: amidase [Thermomicrobiales bacterium]|nr:amidase [Thermomicrobiales bacterium]